MDGREGRRMQGKGRWENMREGKVEGMGEGKVVGLEGRFS